MVLNEASERFEFESPWKNIKPLTVPKSDIQPFSLDEVMLILDNVRQDFKPHYTLRFLRAYAQVKLMDCRGKMWILSVVKSLSIKRSSMAKSAKPKTQGSNRIVQMNQLVYDALLAQKALTFGKSDVCVL